jgi:hypothetical protein
LRLEPRQPHPFFADLFGYDVTPIVDLKSGLHYYPAGVPGWWLANPKGVNHPFLQKL